MNYLKDLSTLDAIQEKYANMPGQRLWSNASNLGTPAQQADYQNSPRFGQGAYNAAFEKWPSATSFINAAKDDLDIQRDPTTGKYTVNYKRTNRDLGTMPTTQITYTDDQGESHNSPERIAPQTADYLLDISQELSRIDPNVYTFDVSTLPGYNQNRNKAPMPLTGLNDREALFKFQPPGSIAKTENPFAKLMK